MKEEKYCKVCNDCFLDNTSNSSKIFCSKKCLYIFYKDYHKEWANRNRDKKKKSDRKYYLKNKYNPIFRRKRREYQKVWSRNNPEKRKVYFAKYREKYRSKRIENTRQWKLKNKIRVKEYQDRWREENYEYVLYLNNRYRVMRLKAEGSFSFKEWEELKRKYAYRCLMCKKEKLLTIDHIIPISKGGSDYIEKIQPLCRSCNSIKGTKI